MIHHHSSAKYQCVLSLLPGKSSSAMQLPILIYSVLCVPLWSMKDSRAMADTIYIGPLLTNTSVGVEGTSALGVIIRN